MRAAEDSGRGELDGAVGDGEGDLGGPDVEFGGGEGGGWGVCVGDLHLRFGAEDCAVVGGDGIEGRDFVGVYDPEVTVG